MASRTRRQKSSDAYKLMYGTCPDVECQAKLYFPSYDKSVECTSCGQRHERISLKNIAEVTNAPVALHNLLKNILLGNVKPKKGADNVKVLGLSNYVCKLISPILTYYGMDRETGKAKKLSEMGKGEMFDVSILGDRAFLIEEEHLDVIGYGRDRSGSVHYLSDTMKDIVAFNDNEVRLVPIHADGDGHCLVHAISRALVGRELFWHALRLNLKTHLETNLEKYKLLFQDFVDKDEWETIIDECDPYYLPPEGEALGLRNIHIFGLANVLHRPIILLDSKTGMSSSGDYSGVFLPGLIAPEKCRGRDGTLNKPLCIAWSSSGHNHYIPIVPVKGRGAARLPQYMVQKSWGVPREDIQKYIEFDNKYRCSIGGEKCLTEKYLRHLVSTMEEIFQQTYEVNPNLVADVHQCIYKSTGIVGVQPTEVIERTQNDVREKILYRCLLCRALSEYTLPRELFEKGGNLYNLAVSIHKKLDPTKLYSFSQQGAVCSYDEKQDCLIPDMTRCKPKTCAFCSGEMLRRVEADGSVLYMDGDTTSTPSVGGKCPCGFKHFWQGKEYDNLPEMFTVPLQWAGKAVTEKIAWFQYESDPTLNSNVFEVAQSVVQKHFPGEFGSERLVQRVVDTILAHTASASKAKEGEGEEPAIDNPWSAETASKIILTGHKKKTIHKEELMKSEAEKNVRKKIQAHAPLVQQKKTAELAAQKAAAAAKAKEQKPSPSTMAQPVVQPEASTSASSQHAKKIRLATSDGRQAMLTLVSDVTYSELQQLIQQEVGVAAERQRIRLGFPPKILEAPGPGEEGSVVALSHGDKLALEILPEQSPEPDLGLATASGAESVPIQETMNPIHAHPSVPANRRPGSWGSFEEDSHSKTADQLLQALKNTQHSGGDSIDTSIASLGILSAVSGKDMWTYVQSMPHLFSVGGLFYSQINRDLGLVDGKHCQLPCLPGKVFRYNGDTDRLELCLEPHGHFPVEPGIEHRVKEGAFDQGVRAMQEQVRFGASGAVSHGHERKAFSGQGHSLKAADDRMPTDLACANHRPVARGFHDLCDPLCSRHESITEEDTDSMQVDEAADGESPSMKYQRLGPGYSRIDGQSASTAANQENSNLEMLRAMAESIKQTLTEEMEEENSSLEMLRAMAESIKQTLTEEMEEDEEPALPETSGASVAASTSHLTDTTKPGTAIHTTDTTKPDTAMCTEDTSDTTVTTPPDDIVMEEGAGQTGTVSNTHTNISNQPTVTQSETRNPTEMETETNLQTTRVIGAGTDTALEAGADKTAHVNSDTDMKPDTTKVESSDTVVNKIVEACDSPPGDTQDDTPETATVGQGGPGAGCDVVDDQGAISDNQLPADSHQTQHTDSTDTTDKPPGSDHS